MHNKKGILTMIVFFRYVLFILLFFFSEFASTSWSAEDEYIEDGIPLLARDSYYTQVNIEKLIADEVIMEEEDAKTCCNLNCSFACIPPWQNKALVSHVFADVFSIAAILSTAASIWYTFNNDNSKDSIFLGKDWNLVSMGTAVAAVLFRLSGDYFDVKKSNYLFSSEDCSLLCQYFCFSCLAARSSSGGCSNFCRELCHDKYQKTGDFCKMLTYAVYPTSAALSILAFFSTNKDSDLQFNVASIVLSSIGAFTSKSLYLYKSLHYKKTNDNKISALEEGRKFVVSASKTLASSMLVDKTMHDGQLSLYERRKKSVDMLKYYNNVRYNKYMKQVARNIIYGKRSRIDSEQHIKEEMKELGLRPTEEESLVFQSVVLNQVENLETLKFIDPFVKRAIARNIQPDALDGEMNSWLSGKIADIERDRLKVKIRKEIERKNDVRRVMPIVRSIVAVNLLETQWDARIDVGLMAIGVNDDIEKEKLKRIIKSEINNLRDIELEHVAISIVTQSLDEASEDHYIDETLEKQGIIAAYKVPFVEIIKNKVLKNKYIKAVEEIARKTLFRRRLPLDAGDDAFITTKLNGRDYNGLTVGIRNRLIPLIREKVITLKMRKIIAPIADKTILSIIKLPQEPDNAFDQRRQDYIGEQLRTLGLSSIDFREDINAAIREFERDKKEVELAEEVLRQPNLNNRDAIRQYIQTHPNHPNTRTGEVERHVTILKFRENAKDIAIHVIRENENRAYVNAIMLAHPNFSELDRFDLTTQEYVDAHFQAPDYTEIDRLDLIEEVRAHTIPSLRHFGFLS